MVRYIIRHGQTDANRLTRVLLSAKGAPLNIVGKDQASKLRFRLNELGLNDTVAVAVSEKIRTQNTASVAGFNNQVVYNSLGEVQTSDINKTFELIAKGLLPDEAIIAAKNLFKNPPKEQIWFTHGLLIAALEIVSGKPNAKNLIPDFCEIRTIDI